MKIFIKYTLTLLLLAVLHTSCDDVVNLDLRDDPNSLSPEAASPNLLLNSVQIAYIGNQEFLNETGAELTRIEYFFGRDYFNNLPGNILNGVWERTYSSGATIIGDSDANNVAVGILTNLQALERANIAAEGSFDFHLGVAKALYAHSLFQIVDFVGVAAFSQAGNAGEFSAPMLDDGESVYNAAFGLLDEAEALLASGPNAQGAQDLFYNGNAAQWIKMINTVRLRSYVLTGNNAAFDAIIQGGDYIAEAADDFQVQFGTSELQPDNRHPDYVDDYKPDGADIYQSNWLMSLMSMNDDPRRRYYFYRQQTGTPGALDIAGVEVDANEEELSCSLVVPPTHYNGFIYCSADAGYWGRSHGNDEGVPPDNFRRTASGVYPAGGRFDDDSFGVVGLGVGGAGAGIEPIFLSSYVDFWQGIMASSAGDRAELMRSGLEKSIAKVQSFGSMDASADLSVAASAEEVTAYIDGMVSNFLSASGDAQENIFAEQYFTTLFGSGVEAYNYYRLTGFPTTVFPSWEPDPGPFPRTLLIPQNEVINNSNVTQKGDLMTQVFWDNNPSSPSFPPAN